MPAKGAPLSVLIRAGTPYSRIAASQIARTWLRSIRETIWQRIKYRLCASVMSVADLCRAYGISRPTAYRWINRYNETGQKDSWIAAAARIPVRTRRLSQWRTLSSCSSSFFWSKDRKEKTATPIKSATKKGTDKRNVPPRFRPTKGAGYPAPFAFRAGQETFRGRYETSVRHSLHGRLTESRNAVCFCKGASLAQLCWSATVKVLAPSTFVMRLML